MKILSIATDNNQVVMITQAHSSGGGQYANPVVLSTVRCSKADLESVLNHIKTKGHRFPKGFEVIERWNVDARSQGPRSKFGRTLALMNEEIEGHLEGALEFLAHDVEDASLLMTSKPDRSTNRNHS